jgi:hypothetical protein
LSAVKRLEKGVAFVSERILDARRRLNVLISKVHPRDLDEIWEAYYDLEEAILMTRVVFYGFDRPGRPRRLSVSAGKSDDEIRAMFQKAVESLVIAEKYLSKQMGEETIVALRKARDQLKALLLADGK